jgi:hypothetical protein
MKPFGRLVFHGSYGSKAKARRKLNAGLGRFIMIRTVKGRRKYLVASRRS